MRLRLTVTTGSLDEGPCGAGPCLREVEVSAPQDSTAAQLAEALAAHVATVQSGRTDRAGGVHLTVGGVPVADDALVGRAPLMDGTAVSVERGPTSPQARDPARQAPAVLAVTHGPDAGRTLDLDPGCYTIGRSPEADLCLADPQLSRIHAEVLVGPDGITFGDHGSTNGTVVLDQRSDTRVTGNASGRLVPGAAIRLGDTELRLRPTRSPPAASVEAQDGTRLVNPRPRVRPALEPVVVELPAPPDIPRRRPIPWLAVALPVPVAAVMAVFLGPTMLAFALMGPVLMMGTHLSDRIGARRRYAVELARHARRQTEVEERVRAACAHEARERRHALPDPATVLGIATDASARLWERRRGDGDALRVAIGTCSTPAAVRLTRPQGGLADAPRLAHVPCGVELAALGVFGVCGPKDVVSGVSRSLVGQLAALHSPRDLSFVLLVSTPDALARWQWLSRLPHLRHPDGSARAGSVAALGQGSAASVDTVRTLVALVSSRHGQRPATGPWSGPWTVVVVDGAAALRAVPGLADVLDRGPDVGVVVLALADEEPALPAETRGVLDLTDAARPVLKVEGHRHEQLVVDQVGPWWADRVSRGLAQLRDATPRTVDGELPDSTSLSQLLPGTSAESIVALWGRPHEGVAVPVGATTRGAWHLDLAVDGPHLLVGGTTGSGKSEFLRSLVISLAVHHPPDEVTFVLVDYKGGAAFRECADLPHTSGLVTDLDEHLAARALVSLTAELSRRERVLGYAGVRDYSDFRRHSTRPLPRLVIVVDEFRALAEDLPSFVDGMVRIAALGRSLGVHLVLATQRPAGVVTADIKANVNLRIALRVRDRADSEDVLEAPDAAALDPHHPGRGFARAGGGELVAFQAAHCVAATPPLEPASIRVRSVDWTETPTERGTSGSRSDSPELARLVGAIREAARLTATSPCPPAWLPPLPKRLLTSELSQPEALRRNAIGLVDRPARQIQEPLVLDLDEPGQWSFVGTVGSGRTTALRTIAAVVTSRLGPTEVHLYAVSAGGLADLADLPHCGAHVALDDLGRLERLVDLLAGRVADRRGSRAADTASALLLVDDWELLAARTDSLEHHTLAERLLTLMREGDDAGLRAVVAGDRCLLSGRAASTLTQRVLLTADRSDALLAGLSPQSLPSTPGPGRGTWCDASEVQLAQAVDLVPLAAGTSPADLTPRRGLPPKVAALPHRVTLDGVWVTAARLRPSERLTGSAHSEEVVYVGIGGDDATPVGLDPTSDGRRWLVSGPSGSGISTALGALTRSLLRARRCVAIVSMRSGPLDELRGAAGVEAWSDGISVDRLVGAREAHPDLCVVVDGADELLDTPADPVLREIGRLVDRHGGLLVVGANSSNLTTQYRGVAVEVGRHRTGILLRPGSIADADLFGLRVRLTRDAPPGRGHLVRRSGATPLQVALYVPPPGAGVGEAAGRSP
jgi:S-DNA-T family DNA segregation ATPase FtsK/SpoIIIE